MSWKEIKEGYGLEEIPKPLASEFCCTICHATAGKLYTNQRLPDAGSPTAYMKQVAQFPRHHVYCRYHAEQMFKD